MRGKARDAMHTDRICAFPLEKRHFVCLVVGFLINSRNFSPRFKDWYIT